MSFKGYFSNGDSAPVQKLSRRGNSRPKTNTSWDRISDIDLGNPKFANTGTDWDFVSDEVLQAQAEADQLLKESLEEGERRGCAPYPESLAYDGAQEAWARRQRHLLAGRSAALLLSPGSMEYVGKLVSRESLTSLEALLPKDVLDEKREQIEDRWGAQLAQPQGDYRSAPMSGQSMLNLSVALDTVFSQILKRRGVNDSVADAVRFAFVPQQEAEKNGIYYRQETFKSHQLIGPYYATFLLDTHRLAAALAELPPTERVHQEEMIHSSICKIACGLHTKGGQGFIFNAQNLRDGIFASHKGAAGQLSHSLRNASNRFHPFVIGEQMIDGSGGCSSDPVVVAKQFNRVWHDVSRERDNGLNLEALETEVSNWRVAAFSEKKGR